MRIRAYWLCLLVLLLLPLVCSAQSTYGVIRGTVTLEESNLALHNVSVLIVQLGRSVQTGEEGNFEFTNVPPGTYDLVATTAALTSDKAAVEVTAGNVATLDFKVKLSPVRQEVTVTASGVQETTFESFQVVNTLDSFQLADQGATSVGEVLQNEPGVSKRSMGPGSSRPVIRGFDGDRVLVLQDGVRTGSLASQSGDHGEPIDVLQLDRLEVVKGPATLLYGSNAVGGVVNAVSGHLQMEERATAGLRGTITGIAGSGNHYGGGGIGFEYGTGNWLMWGTGGNQKTRDYRAPDFFVPNTQTRVTTGTAGFGYYSANKFVGLNYGYDDSRYGIPAVTPDPNAPPDVADIASFRRGLRLSGGLANHNKIFEHIRYDLSYTGYVHNEIDKNGIEDEVATHFDNKTYTFQAFLDQRKSGRLTGTLGFSTSHRNYDVQGEEALSPPVISNVGAVFGLEELNLDALKLQFGGRLETTRHTPEGDLVKRDFTGLSGSVGAHVPLWMGGAFVVNYTHSYRAPAIEELYNHGPHPGNVSFEIGRTDLERERSDGLDLSLRHLDDRIRFDANFFYYDIGNFVYLAPTGRITDGLIEAEYAQAPTRYTGTEIAADFPIHPNLYVTTGLDYVNAELKSSHTPLPRIPPLRFRLGLDARYKGLSIKPEATMVQDQDHVFTTENRTPGYTLLDFNASYTIPQQHLSHHFAINVFNAGDRLYRNHVSLIKDLAPEIGRGVKVTYSMKFF